MADEPGGDDDLEVPFIFVPHGAPEPTEWMAAHPGWVKFPATFVPHGRREAQGTYITAQIAPVAAVSGMAEAGLLGGGALAEVELGVAAGVGAVTAPALAALLVLWPSRMAGPEMDKYHGGHATGAGDVPPEGFTASPPLPPPPGLVPPQLPGAKPGEEGFSIPPSPPSLPDSLPPPLPQVLPGPEAQPQGPTIYEQGRNDGLSGGLRSDSRRARDAARKADPAVTQGLKNAGWWAHHLINIGNIHKFRDIFDAAAKAGWRTDDVGNAAPLPTTPEEQRKLKERGIDRPTHRGGHPDWNEEVFDGLWKIRIELSKSDLVNKSNAYNMKARKLLNKLQDELRQKCC